MLHSVLPEMAQAMDESLEVKFLNTELQSLARFDESPDALPSDGNRFVDFLASVPLKSGQETWVLLHVEIQGRGGKDPFPARMHHYRCLIEGRYNRPVVGLALITHPLPGDQEEGVYRWSQFGTRVTYEYTVLRLYEGDEEALRESDNPFDLAHYAGMQALKQRGSDQGKLGYMKILLGELKKRHWSHEDKAFLLWFIEGIMNVKDRLVWEEWDGELERQKEDGEMYVSLMERKGRREGRREGLKRGLERGMRKGLEKGLEEGLEKGRLEGLEEGLEKGLKKGLEKGLLKGKLAAARKMLAQGEPDEKILYFTEITSDQLEGLRRERVSG